MTPLNPVSTVARTSAASRSRQGRQNRLQFVCLALAIRLHIFNFVICNSFAYSRSLSLWASAFAIVFCINIRRTSTRYMGTRYCVIPSFFRLQFVASCWQVVCILVRYRLVHQRSLSRFHASSFIGKIEQLQSLRSAKAKAAAQIMAPLPESRVGGPLRRHL